MKPSGLFLGPRYTGRSASAGVCLPGPRSGITLIELLLVIAVLAATSTIALPAIARMRVAASVQNSKAAVVSSLSLARATAMRYGRPAVLRIDAAGDRVWVEVDTTSVGDGTVVDTLGSFDFAAKLNVDLMSDRTSFCFDGRGVGTTSTTCPLAGAEIVVRRQTRADTVVVSPLGRVLQ